MQPYAVHMTWTYNGVPGKRARLRDMGLWMADPPEYYSQGSFLTVDLQLPEVRRAGAAAAGAASAAVECVHEPSRSHAMLPAPALPALAGPASPAA